VRHIVATHSGDNTHATAIIANVGRSNENVSEFAPRRQVLSRDRSQSVFDLNPKVLRRLELRNHMKCPDLAEE
jgi:hypothetical protein